jgi:hypothetical protein
MPKLHRVAMLWNKDDLGMSLRYDASAKAATAMGSMCRRWVCVNRTISTRRSR